MKNLFRPKLLSILAAAVSCGCNTDQVVKDFPVEKELRAEYTPYDELLNVTNIVKLEDYVILQNGSESIEDFFFVYSFPEFEFLYSFAKNGRGPHEYLFPAVIENTPGNLLSFKDHATDVVTTYELTDSGAVLNDSRVFKSKDRRFFWEMNYMEDSIYLVKHQDHKQGARELWDIRAQVLADSIANTFGDLPAEMGKNYFTIFDDYLISANGNRFAIGYCMIDRIEFGKVEGRRMEIEAHVGMEYPPRFHLYGSGESGDFNIDKNTVFYENLYTTDRNVYALYSRKRMDETEAQHSSVMETYSWDGTPVALYRLEHPLAAFFVDEAGRTIYGINRTLFDDQIIRYHY